MSSATPNATVPEKVRIDEEELKKRIPNDAFIVLRRKGTERAYSGKFYQEKSTGMYKCAACSNPLFTSDTKFDSHCGWPAFYDAIKGSVDFHEDVSHGMKRVEVTCAKCDSHLGHVFDDGFGTPTGQRFCINSVCLDFDKK
eukprot:ANDGO_06684.mRNA.1 Peptide methionine sulfoxide reductase MsrB